MWIRALLMVFLSNASLASTPSQQAWDVLRAGASDKSAHERAAAIHALGLVPRNTAAVTLAEQALEDKSAQVRAAGAVALGQMHAAGSIAKLKNAMRDAEPSVVLAAAHALEQLRDKACYEVYYAILTGERKTGDSLMSEQMKTLKDPKKMAQMGFEQGIGFVPFGGAGYEAIRMLTKDDASPVRAAAATSLANDPDPLAAKALVKAVFSKSWLVRAAALSAIAKRGDASLLNDIAPAMEDKRSVVRYTAAATVVRLSELTKKP